MITAKYRFLNLRLCSMMVSCGADGKQQRRPMVVKLMDKVCAFCSFNVPICPGRPHDKPWTTGTKSYAANYKKTKLNRRK